MRMRIFLLYVVLCVLTSGGRAENFEDLFRVSNAPDITGPLEVDHVVPDLPALPPRPEFIDFWLAAKNGDLQLALSMYQHLEYTGPHETAMTFTSSENDRLFMNIYRNQGKLARVHSGLSRVGKDVRDLSSEISMLREGIRMLMEAGTGSAAEDQAPKIQMSTLRMCIPVAVAVIACIYAVSSGMKSSRTRR
jgi:hypothetical protein